jgi:hypothetical protein
MDRKFRLCFYTPIIFFNYMQIAPSSIVYQQIPCGLVVRIRGFHPRGPGSIPGTGKLQAFIFGLFPILVYV